MKYTVLVLILLIGFNKCYNEKETLNQDEVEFSNHFAYKGMINKLIITFDEFLESKYAKIPNSEDRVRLFLKDIEKMFTSEEYKSQKKEMIQEFQVFNTILNELNTTDFFIEYKSHEKQKVLKWVDSLKGKRAFNQIGEIDYENIPTQKENTTITVPNTSNRKNETDIISVTNKRINNEFYFYLYKEINEHDAITKKWIERMFTWPGKSATYEVIKELQKEKNRKLLNSPYIKLLIATEIIIPYFDFSIMEFSIN